MKIKSKWEIWRVSGSLKVKNVDNNLQNLSRTLWEILTSTLEKSSLQTHCNIVKNAILGFFQTIGAVLS